MTEAEWLTCRSGSELGDLVKAQIGEGQRVTPRTWATARTLRLVEFAYCRRHTAGLAPVFLELLTVAEQQVDAAGGRLAPTPLRARAHRARRKLRDVDGLCFTRWYFATAVIIATTPSRAPFSLGGDLAMTCFEAVGRRAAWDGERMDWYGPAYRAAGEAELAAQADVCRDIFGNPFCPAAFSPEWRTSTAVALASQMYESRDFGAMPILADALQDAGCDNDDILNHCRDAKQVHVRGCWVVDLVLGKE